MPLMRTWSSDFRSESDEEFDAEAAMAAAAAAAQNVGDGFAEMQNAEDTAEVVGTRREKEQKGRWSRSKSLCLATK